MMVADVLTFDASRRRVARTLIVGNLGEVLFFSGVRYDRSGARSAAESTPTKSTDPMQRDADPQ